MSDKIKIESGKLSQFRPSEENANAHTQRGMGMLNNAMRKSGFLSPITTAADGESLDGSARLEQAFDVFGDEAVIIRHDGSKPIVMVREDIPNAKTPEAKIIAYEANRIAQVDLAWDASVIVSDLELGLDLSSLWSPDELSVMLEGAADSLLGGDGNTTQDLPEEEDGDVSGLLAPFPWFGGKSRVAGRIWKRFGEVRNYVEPFCGSAAVLLACPYELPIVTLNDMDGFVANFWRAVAYAPDEVAKWVDWPVNENDLFARHVWLIKRTGELVKALETDPDYYDAKIAGWWCWGACAWIGTGWCRGEGAWMVEDGEIKRRGYLTGDSRQIPHLGNQGQGVNRKLPRLSDRGGVDSAASI